MREVLFAFLSYLLLLKLAYSFSVVVSEGNVTDIGVQNILTEFGMVRGTITFRLGNYTWAPREIWLLPEGTTPNQFKSTSAYLELPEGIVPTTCKTSLYYNESIGYAFKILGSQIFENGSFCGLAYEGDYDVLAKY